MRLLRALLRRILIWGFGPEWVDVQGAVDNAHLALALGVAEIEEDA